jgi:hypothetical protein
MYGAGLFALDVTLITLLGDTSTAAAARAAAPRAATRVEAARDIPRRRVWTRVALLCLPFLMHGTNAGVLFNILSRGMKCSRSRSASSTR